jgi:hypothetical protein
MLNKKILAVAVATVFSTNAFSAVDLNADTGNILVAAESIGAANLNVDGLVVLTDAGTVLEVVADAGFSIAKTTSKYVRYDLTNGEFATIADIDDGLNTPVTAVSAGGVGESFAVFELAADTASVTAATNVTLDATYAMTDGAALSVQYRLFETAQDAVNATAAGLATSSGVVATIASVVTGDFSTSLTAQAKVASQFEDFDGAGDQDADLATIAITALVDTTPASVTTDSATPFVAGSLGTGTATVTFTGDFSFGEFAYGTGTWGFDADGEFVGTNATLNESGTVTVPFAASTFAVSLVDVDAEDDIAQKGTYTAALAGVIATGVTTPSTAIGTFTEAAGAITYDTTSIDVPYVTTFSSYNQRIYLINGSGQDASYTTSFVSEDGVTATAGVMASGVVPAGEMLAIKATDLVTLTGKTRTSATIEIEAQNSAVTATSQTVNLATGTTDTVALYGSKDAVLANIDANNP